MYNTSYKDKALAFEKIIHIMQGDLQKLANKGKVNNRFIAKQNRILKTLIDYFNEIENHIISLQGQLVETQIANSNHREYLTDRITKLEAICIMHGILDFPRFMAQSLNTLSDWAEDLYKDEKSFMLSHSLQEFIRDLSEAERIVIEKILFKRIHRKVNTLLNEINRYQKRKIRYKP